MYNPTLTTFDSRTQWCQTIVTLIGTFGELTQSYEVAMGKAGEQRERGRAA